MQEGTAIYSVLSVPYINSGSYTDMQMKVPVLELDCTASAIDIGVSHHESGYSSCQIGTFECKSV
jgi:hypothetical protein